GPVDPAQPAGGRTRSRPLPGGTCGRFALATWHRYTRPPSQPSPPDWTGQGGRAFTPAHWGQTNRAATLRRSMMRRGSGYVEVWEEGGVWHWAYRDPEEDVVLLGNRTYPTRAGAVAAARTAYRSVPIREPAAPRDR